ncbi:MAG TPA: DedA family protein [Chloroflexia bacterium]|nr:DedA family protein [Chloroflexia bacterium]
MNEVLGLLDTYGIALLFVVLLLKEIGVPVPVPGDLLMLVAGARAATGELPLWGVLLSAVVAGVIGAFIQYLLARGPARGFIYRFGKYVGLTPARLDKAAAGIKGRGWVALALARALPGLRVGAVAACGLAAVPLSTFVAGLVAGTLLFVGFHTMLGYVAGPGISTVLDSVSIPVLPVLLAVAVIGLVGWLLIRARRKRAQAQSEGEPAAVFDWADACCPACLAAGALERRIVSSGQWSLASDH